MSNLIKRIVYIIGSFLMFLGGQLVLKSGITDEMPYSANREWENQFLRNRVNHLETELKWRQSVEGKQS